MIFVISIFLVSITPVSGFFSQIPENSINDDPLKNERDIPSLTSDQGGFIGDFDPLIDIEVTVDIISIRTLNDDTDPDFFVKVIINSEEFLSPIWQDSPYLDNIHWTATANVPDDVEFVDIVIELQNFCTFRSEGK
jgi:hypothetical protein